MKARTRYLVTIEGWKVSITKVPHDAQLVTHNAIRRAVIEEYLATVPANLESVANATAAALSNAG